MKKKYFIWIAILFLPIAASSQEEAAFAIQFEDVLISEALEVLEMKFDVRFSYKDALLTNKRVSLQEERRTLSKTLQEINSITGLLFQRIDDRYIYVRSESPSLEATQMLDDVIVTGYLTSGISKTKNGSFNLSPLELEVLPGLTEADILESLQQLPGVISPNETATGLIVRGGRADQNRILWDGINIYHKGHLFGMISAFNPNSVEKVSFSNKGTHPRYGERISSVISITSKKEINDLFSAGVGVNGISADAHVQVPLIADKLSLYGAVRRSYDEVYESFTFNKLADKVFQSTKIRNAENSQNEFYFLDYNLQLNYKFDGKNRLYFSTIQIDNALDYLVTDKERNSSFNDILDIQNEGYSGLWEILWSDKVTQQTQVSLSKYKFDYTFVEQDSLAQTSDFRKRNVILDSGITSEVSMETKDNNELTFGYQYSLKDVSFAFLEMAELSFILDSDRTVERTHALFSNFSYRNPRIFDFNAGVRATYFHGLEAVRLEPRIFIYKNIAKNLKLQVSAEIKNQIISEIDETVFSDLSLENKLWRLADGKTFPIINSKQLSMGLIYTENGWSLDTDYYYKKINGITALSLGFLNPLDSQFHIGEQRVLGADLYIKKDFHFFNTWCSYSFNRVENRYDGLNNEAYFTSSNNIKHAFTASAAYKKKGFQVALGWNWRSGKPFTEALMNTDGTLFFQKINTERLPGYHRLDLSTTYDFHFSEENKLKGKIGFSIRNVYDQNNQLSREYSGNNNLNDPVSVVDKFSLGFTPNFLVRVYW
ncbi:MAG: TonB-dependent receptor plug domain-containing protein [Bacteroidota bacterium]